MSTHLHTVADWEKPQIKTFTKWVNAQLVKSQMSIEDIATDFEDGIKLVKLCEVLFQKEVPMHSNPRLKFHKLENIDAALRLMAEAGVPQTGITNEMIISHNRKMILGMIWMLILRVQIEGITVEEMTAKEGLLLWCKRMTASYAPDVAITNFTSSWRNGLAFLSLLHKYNPTLVPDYQDVKREVAEEVASGVDNVEQSIARLNRAFKVAEESLEIPVLVDAEDVVSAPDDRSIMTYVSMWFHRFGQRKDSDITRRRIAALVEKARRHHEMQCAYETAARAVLSECNTSKPRFAGRDPLPKEEAEAALREVMDYDEKGISALKEDESAALGLLSALQLQRKADGRAAYLPPGLFSGEALTAAVTEVGTVVKGRRQFLLRTLADLSGAKRCRSVLDNALATAETWTTDARERLSRDIPVTSAAVSAEQQRLAPLGTALKHHQERLVQPIKSTLTTLKDHQPSAEEVEEYTSRVEALEKALLKEIPAALAARKDTLSKQSKTLSKRDDAQKGLAAELLQALGDVQGLVDSAVAEGASLGGIAEMKAAGKRRKSAESNLASYTKKGEGIRKKVLKAEEKLEEEHIMDNPHTALRKADIEEKLVKLDAAVTEANTQLQARFEEIERLHVLRQEMQHEFEAFTSTLATAKEMESSLEKAAPQQCVTVINQIMSVSIPTQIEPCAERVSEIASKLGPGDSQAQSTLKAVKTALDSFIDMLKARQNVAESRIEMNERKEEGERLMAERAANEGACAEYASSAQSVMATLTTIHETCPLADASASAASLGEGITAAQGMQTVYENLAPQVATLREQWTILKAEPARYPLGQFSNLEQDAIEARYTATGSLLADRTAELHLAQTAAVAREATLAEVSVQIDAANESVNDAASNLEMAKALPETTDIESQLQMWNAAATALAACPEECKAATSAALLTGDVDLVDRMRDVSIRLDAHLSECVSRTSTLEGQKLAADMGTVSEEQLAEWRELYNRFDKNHDNSLNTVELGALLTSLNEARTEDELKGLCTDGKCTFAALCEYLKSRETDSHSKEEVAGAFAALAAEEGGLTVASLEKAGVSEDDIEFLVQRMEAGEPNEAGAVTYSCDSLIQSMFM